MVYVRKSVASTPGELINLMDKLGKKHVSSIYVPVKGGSVKALSERSWRYSALQCETELTDKATEDFMKYILTNFAEKYGSGHNDALSGSFEMNFNLNVNPSNVLEDGADVEMVVPVSMSIFPGRLEYWEDGRPEVKKGNYTRSDKEEKEDAAEVIKSPLFVKEITFDNGNMEELNRKYLARRGVDIDLHNNAILMAEAAKQNLGFDYKKINLKEGRCKTTLVCATPQEFYLGELIDGMKSDMNKLSFENAIIELKTEGKDSESKTAKIFPYNNKKILQVETSNNARYEMEKLLKTLDLRFGRERIVYNEYKESPIKGISVVPSGVLAGICYIPEAIYSAYKASESPILHPRKAHKRREERRQKIIAEENSTIAEFFESFGIKPNTDRGSSCLFQYERNDCLTKAEEWKAEQDSLTTGNDQTTTPQFPDK